MGSTAAGAGLDRAGSPHPPDDADHTGRTHTSRADGADRTDGSDATDGSDRAEDTGEGADVVRVATVDDHEAVREGVRAWLADHRSVRVVAGAATAGQLVAHLRATGLPVDVVLLDLRLADRSHPADNVRDLLASGTDVIVYANLESGDDLRAAVGAGALGAVGKAQPMADLLEAIHVAARGEPLLTTEWAAALDAAPRGQRPALSDRESEALRLYASGLGMKSGARRMGITLGTYKEYLLRVRRKYADVDRPARTKLALYHRAVEDGHLRPGDGPTTPAAPER